MIVLFAEDPGAVNCVAPIAAALDERGNTPLLLSDGLATQIFRERGLSPQPEWDEAEVLRRRPELVLVGTSENRESRSFALLQAARQMGVPSIAVIDSSANPGERFRGDTTSPLAFAPDILLVPDQEIADAFGQLGLAAERVCVVGHPNDDRARAVAAQLSKESRKALRKRLFTRSDRRVLVFVSEISAGLAEGGYSRDASYTLLGRGGRHLRSEVVVEELLDAVDALEAEGMERPHLVLRRHPKETAKDLHGLAEAFDQVNQGGDAHPMIFAADLTVGMTTMLLNEARLMGTPTLSILPKEVERGWLAPIRDGEIESVTKRDDLRRRLRSLLTARRDLPAGEPQGALDRILDVIDRVKR